MQIPSKLKPFIYYPMTHNIFEGGRGGGKTRTIGGLIVEALRQQPLGIICAREKLNSIKDSSFSVLAKEIYRQGYASQFDINESRGTITSVSGGRAVMTGLLQHTVDSIKSFEDFHWAWIEESQSVSKKSLETLIPTLRTDGWISIDLGGYEWKVPLRMFMYTMNPYTWEDPINLVLPESREDTRRIQINYYDNPWFPDVLEQERIEAKRVMTTDEYLRIWEGIPYESAESSVMTRKQVLSAMERNVPRDGGIVVGADIARFGDDRTVFVKREGLQVIDTKILSKKDTQEVASLLVDFAAGGKINVDDTGVGGGVTDRLRRIGANVQPINFGGSPMDKKKYPDIISEMWFNLAGIIDKAGLPNDPELLAELSSRHYKYTPDERRKVESKEEYKRRTGRRSPDMADAMILCFYNRDTTIKIPSRRIPGI